MGMLQAWQRLSISLWIYDDENCNGSWTRFCSSQVFHFLSRFKFKWLDNYWYRKGPHTSYSTNGSINHITGDILDSAWQLFSKYSFGPVTKIFKWFSGLSQSGFSLHFYLSDENVPLPDTPELPNPQLWPINGKSCPKKRRKRNRKNKKKTAWRCIYAIVLSIYSN